MAVLPPIILRLILVSLPHLCWKKLTRLGGTPHAAFDASTCDPYNFFSAQTLVLNINLCGMSLLTSFRNWVEEDANR